ncbi:MAG: hypothetical protein AAGI17_08850 [Planctomycetota bacterium]
MAERNNTNRSADRRNDRRADRRRVIDQTDRGPGDRRKSDSKDGSAKTGLERRRGPGRRLSDFSKAAENGELTPEQFAFVRAMEAFKKANGVGFPSWTDVIEVIRLLGYRKVQASQLSLQGVEDWREKPDADAGVRPDNWEKRFTMPKTAAAPDVTDLDEQELLDLDDQDFSEAA